MRKIIVMGVCLILAVSLAGCGPGGAEDGGESGGVPKLTQAAEVLQAFKDEGLPVIGEIEYTAETDTNGLLGRPGQYTQKVNFNDKRFAKAGDSPAITIERFNSKGDLEKRYEYVKGVSAAAGVPALQYYYYKTETMLLRIPYAVTPEAAAEYEAVFLRVAK